MFRIHAKAKDWSSGLGSVRKSVIKTQMDLYYLFLIVGLASGKYVKATTANTDEISKDFTADLAPYKDLIVGIVLMTELNLIGADLSRSNISEKLHSLIVDGRLSNEAVERMNGYAAGGFEMMRDIESSPPRDAHDFLLWFARDVLPAAFPTSHAIGLS